MARKDLKDKNDQKDGNGLEGNGQGGVLPDHILIKSLNRGRLRGKFERTGDLIP